MEQELFKQLLAFVLGGAIGAILKYWFDYKAMVYKELWQKRYETYKKLHSLTGILPLYPKRENITYEDLFKRSELMRDWYFKEGGLLLSGKSKKKYFDVQKKIQRVLEGRGNESRFQTIDDDYDPIRDLFSDLRTELTNDLMSRDRFFGRKNSEPRTTEK